VNRVAPGRATATAFKGVLLGRRPPQRGQAEVEDREAASGRMGGSGFQIAVDDPFRVRGCQSSTDCVARRSSSR